MATLGFLAIPFLSEIIPKDRRAQINALATAISGIATSVGPIIQGSLNKHEVSRAKNGWQVGFYIGACLPVVSFVMVYFFHQPSPRYNPENLLIWTHMIRIYWPGVLVITAGLTFLLAGLQYGDNPFTWDSPTVLSCLIVGGIMILFFCVWGWKDTKHGFFHNSLFEQNNHTICLTLSFVGRINLFGGQAYLPRDIIRLFTSDALLTGVYNLPLNLAGIFGASICAAIVARMRKAKWVM